MERRGEKMPQNNEYMLKQDDAELIYQKKLTAGTNITIDPVTNTISSTGGGGSSVSYSGSLPQGYGDTIGIITIDGTQYPIKIRNLIQGSNINIVQDMTTGNLTISSTAQSTRVEPNPSGTPTNTLDTIGINGTIYEIEGGGSGNVADVYVNGTSVLDENDIAQVFSHQEITEQEYEALPSTKESDNIMYCIKGSRPSTNGNYFTPIIYSTEEREIGVWINGKPLYQKTLVFEDYTNGTYQDVSSLNIEEIVNNFGEHRLADYNYGLSFPYYENNNWYSLMTFDKNNGRYYVYCSSQMADIYKRLFITIQYTKTTDVAGSGQYAALGVPAHHYDGNEKVVGTYFGETLYEKTIHISEASEVETNQYTTEIQSLNADKVFLVNGRVKLGSIANGIWINSPYYNSVNYNTSVGVTNTEITVVATRWKYTEVELTIQYTKTS